MRKTKLSMRTIINHKASQFFFRGVIGFMTFSSIAAHAQQFSVVYEFNGTNGLSAGTDLARDNFGNLYGSALTTQQCDGQSCGAVYKVNPAGQLIVLHTFQGPPDGIRSIAVTPVPGQSTFDPATLYGTTQNGGTSTYPACQDGCGTVFKLSSDGTETVLHDFTAPPSDGILPAAGVIAVPGATADSPDTLYGTTYYGGPFSMNGLPGEGTIFKIVNGRESLLYKFTGGNDGALPAAAPLYRAGVLYGTTVFGGQGTCVTTFGTGCGVVYKLVGTQETVLYSFQNQADGGFPSASLIADRAGNLYGTAVLGGDLNCSISSPPPGCGTIFKVSPTGQETVLHTFTGGADGAWPSAALVMDSAGNLYGTAVFGGNLNCQAGDGFGCGTVFKIDTGGNFSVLHTFTGSDGAYPLAIVQATQGALYGVTEFGGPTDQGVIYKLVP